MKLFLVDVKNQYGNTRSRSTGFETRAAAERFAAGLAASGHAKDGVAIESYEDDDSDDSDE